MDVWVDRYLLVLHHGFENANYNFDWNGGRFVLQLIRELVLIQTVFDVGANMGG